MQCLHRAKDATFHHIAFKTYNRDDAWGVYQAHDHTCPNFATASYLLKPGKQLKSLFNVTAVELQQFGHSVRLHGDL